MATLADKIKKFSKVKLRKVSVKVPKLKVKQKKLAQIVKSKDEALPTSTIIKILIKAAVEKAKRERKEKAIEEDKKYAISGEEKPIAGGYGTLSKSYGMAPFTSYVDYEKLFSYLGKFKSQSHYENVAEHVGALNKSLEIGSFTLVGTETMEKGKKYIRYFHPKVPVDKTSLAPLPGMSSAEWEEFKWFMRLDTTMYLLKISSA